MIEDQYWYNRASQDEIYQSRQHEQTMSTLVTENEYKLFAMLRPTVSIDGNMYIVLYGENIQEGIAGFGETVHKAILNFNQNFHEPIKSYRQSSVNTQLNSLL